MFDYQSVYNGYTALLAGLVTSVHCVAMCGPLSCAFMPVKKGEASPHVVLTVYHLSKLLAYLVVGALAGAFGSVILGAVQDSWLNYLPWFLVFFFIAVAFRLDRFFPKPVWLGRAYGRLTVRFRSLGKPLAAGLIGFASPLLPCGPLYMIFGLALFTGSAAQGAEFAVGFGLGTLPLLWLAQSQFMRVRHLSNPRLLKNVQRAAAGIAALVVMWRLRGTLGIEAAVDWICS
ncbi:MAG: sulfite exporter TauE/SafE family protein [Verrucomicrobia bacterium]|nr:sulfite exporter TauE/SafE family protein [Verrucomicrobiota bacterium]